MSENISDTMSLPRVLNSNREEIQELVLAQLETLLVQSNYEAAKAILIPVQSADVADVIEALPTRLQVVAFRLLSKDKATDVYEHLDTPIQEELI